MHILFANSVFLMACLTEMVSGVNRFGLAQL